MATEHLLGLDCRRRILFLGDITLPEVALRYEGYIKAHEGHEIDVDKDLVLALNFGGETALRSRKRLRPKNIQSVKPPIEIMDLSFDAIFAASDVLAMAAIHALQAIGRSVPTDVAIVGYDDVGQAAMSTPPLTTINQNIAKGGEMMVDMLLDKIANKPVESAYTPTDLIIRQSCGGKS